MISDGHSPILLGIGGERRHYRVIDKIAVNNKKPAADALHTDGDPMDYIDETGCGHIMCSYGHRMSGGMPMGRKYAVCPNCRLMARLGAHIRVVYPDRFPDDGIFERVREDVMSLPAAHYESSSSPRLLRAAADSWPPS